VINKHYHENKAPPFDVELQVMDLATEVFLKMEIDKFERRRYRAFFRQRVFGVGDESELVDATIFVLRDPTFEGVVVSDLQQVLELCASLDGKASRREMQDVRATTRERITRADTSKKGAMTTEKEINAANIGRMSMAAPGYLQAEGISREFTPNLNSTILPGTLEHEHGIVAHNNAFLLEEHKKAVDGQRPEKLYKRRYNPQLGRNTYQPQFDYWAPMLMLPEYESLEHAADYSYNPTNYVEQYEMTARHLAKRFGVPVEFALGIKSGVGSDIDFSNDQFKTTIETWQRHLERLVATLYAQCYGRDLINSIEDEFERDSFERSEKKRNAVKVSGDPGGKRIKIGDGETLDEHEKEKEKPPTDVRPADPKPHRESGPKQGEAPPHYESDGEPEQYFLTADQIEELEQSINIAVHFHENPVLTQQMISTFEEKKYITREMAAELTFDLVGLSRSLIATPEQLMKEAKFRHKLQEAENPTPPPGSEAPAKPSNPSPSPAGPKESTD
jgi:hypothetical protein